jgi:putative hemolysin
MEGYIIVVSLLFSALFSGIEIAYVSSNKLRIELSGNRGSITGRILSRFNQIPSYFIGAMLIGNNIALVIYGIAMASLLEPQLSILIPESAAQDVLVMVLQTIIATLLVLVTGEFIPKLLFRINPNGILHAFAVPIGVLFILLSPFVAIIIIISKLILRGVFRIKVTESKPVFNRLDLEAFVHEHQQANGEEESAEINTELFQNALYLIKVKVRECMIPRTEIQALDIASGMDALRILFIESNLSRIVIYDGSIDNIIGYVHHHDMLRQPDDIRKVMFPIPMIPETMPATDVLNLFTKEQKTIACVVDEYGGTAGIVTLEDILEEIFGEIEDEYDQDEFVEKQLSDQEYIFSGRLEIDHLNETYNLGLPTGEYETLGGMIVAHHGSIPRMKEHILIGHFEFIILYSSDTKVDTVKLRILQL